MVTVIAPIALPAAVGANATFSVAVCPGVKVMPLLAPLTEYPAPVTLTPEMLTFAFPAFVSVALKKLLLPTNTLPKSSALVFDTSSAVAAVVLPFTEITSGEFGASLVSEIDPVMFPAVVGANTTLNVVLWPAAMLAGNVSPVWLKPAPLTAICEIVTAPVPPLDNAIVCELLEPTLMFGKLALLGAAASCGCGLFPGAGVPAPPLDPFDPITTPAQPFASIEAANAITTRHNFNFIESDPAFPIVGPV